MRKLFLKRNDVSWGGRHFKAILPDSPPHNSEKFELSLSNLAERGAFLKHA